MHPNPNPKMKWTNKIETKPKKNFRLNHDACKICWNTNLLFSPFFDADFRSKNWIEGKGKCHAIFLNVPLCVLTL